MVTKKQRIIELCTELHHEVKTAIDVRSVFYAAVGEGLCESKRTQFNYVDKVLVEAREDGIIPIRWIYDPGRTIYRHDGDESEWKPVVLKAAEDLETCGASWIYPMWRNQPNYVEIWFEKEGLTPIFDQVAEEWQTIAFPARGYSSLTLLHRAANRFRRARNRGKNVYLLYFGDWDSSGWDMDRDIRARMEKYGSPAFEFIRIAATPEQVSELGLPPMMPKKTDSRSPAFERMCAEKGWTTVCAEVNALTRGGHLQRLAKEAIEKYIDMDIWNADREEHDRKTGVIEQFFEEHGQDIITDFKEYLDNFSEDIDDDEDDEYYDEEDDEDA